MVYGKLDARSFGSIIHNDGSNLYYGNAGDGCTATEYKAGIRAMLEMMYGLLDHEPKDFGAGIVWPVRGP